MVYATSPVQVVPLGEDRWLEFLQRSQRAFQNDRRMTEADLGIRRPLYEEQRLSGVVDEGRLVSTFRSWDGDLPVPGGSTTVDLISSVTVEPTHRRRGILRTMMTADLRRAWGAGTPVAMLQATESPIYGRFGFGKSLDMVTWRVETPTPLMPAPPGVDDVTVMLVEDADLAGVAPAVYDDARVGQPGAIPLTPPDWDVLLGTVTVPGVDRDKIRPALLAWAGGTVVGYARYSITEATEHKLPTSELTVDELAARTPQALVALWRQLLSMDLVATVIATNRPSSDRLPELLADRRRAIQTDNQDAHWLRVLDVPAALTARRFSAPVDVVVDVTDPLGLATGRWRVLAADVGDGTNGWAVEVTESDADPDVVMDVGPLSAAYLGQTPLLHLQDVGRVTEHSPGAVRRLGAALAWEPSSAPTLHGF